MKEINSELLSKAYKKLKSSVYFDKTSIILRDKIVDFESSIKNIEDYFIEFAKIINDKNKFKKLEKEIINSISVLSFPKNLKDRNKIENSDKKSVLIINSCLKKMEIADVQNFIDMDVRGHILGVLWLMSVGYRLDEKLYSHSYGNRIRENLYSEFSNNPTYSPYLFQPYFEQYENWRDNAMEKALEHLKKGQDVIILTLDFKRYYYSIDMNKDAFNAMYDDAFKDDVEKNTDINKKLNEFVYFVIEKYSSKFNMGRNILPIGFLPSNVLGNWFLNSFDNAIVDGWNPIYFGRYVDDVLIVDKVEQNGIIHKKIQDGSLSVEEIINYYFIQCSKWSGLHGNFQCENLKENGLFIEDNDSECKTYKVNKKYLVPKNNNSEISLQKDKLRVFYFKKCETDALITCFRNNISKNKSEFRYMPEDVAVFQRDDYSEIYHLQTDESPNKFRGINGILLDKYELSKFLGKHLRIGGLIEDVVESKFEKDINVIFNNKVIIENYLSWEKVIEIFVINERFETVKQFVFSILNAINELMYNKNEVITIEKIKSSLYLHLYSAVNRAFALVWKDKSSKILKEIYYKLKKFGIDIENIDKKRINYCKTRMVDKYVMPIPIDMFDIENIIRSGKNINLTHFYEVLSATNEKFKEDYIYYPYLVTMYDFSIISAIEQFNHANSFEDIKEIYDTQNKRYIYCNYRKKKCKETSIKIAAINSIGKNIYGVSVGDSKKDKLSIAIANVKLNHKNFEKLIKGQPNRSYERYRDVSILVNNSIEEKTDMLIMPESFIPFEWLPTLARTCAKNCLAIVTGVEHILFKDKVFNLTAVILPYKEKEHRCANISFHLKTHYAPNEKSEIHGYNFKEIEGNIHELYKWNDCYFPVYCCYELASIKDRALFQSYADFLIAIEWNRDVNYYSNILESLSRDIHCYCIQVNSSDYGDSRVTKPSKTEEKDMIRTKGGKNSTILIETIDISVLRDFQIKNYELQKNNYHFKTTPPNFESEIVMKKIKGKDIIATQNFDPKTDPKTLHTVRKLTNIKIKK